MRIWKAHYWDKLHDEDIEIINIQEGYSTNPLSFTLDGITFYGTSIGDFELNDGSQYDVAKEKFCLLKWGGHEVQGILHIVFRYLEHDIQKRQSIIIECDNARVYRDDQVVLEFSLCMEDRVYESSIKSLCFESSLLDISKQIQENYYIKSCFTCQYSDYSPYGSDDYGAMLCYRRCKEEYLKVNNKDDFFEYLEMKDFDTRQEDYLCEEYAVRNKCAGYRGFVDGCR